MIYKSKSFSDINSWNISFLNIIGLYKGQHFLPENQKMKSLMIHHWWNAENYTFYSRWLFEDQLCLVMSWIWKIPLVVQMTSDKRISQLRKVSKRRVKVKFIRSKWLKNDENSERLVIVKNYQFWMTKGLLTQRKCDPTH